MAKKMILDLAEERFESAPHLSENAATLLNTAMRYWLDDMITDETFAVYVMQARDWIKEARISNKPVPKHGALARRRGYLIKDCPFDATTGEGKKWRREWTTAV